MKKLKKFLLFIACCLTACAIAIPFAACAEDPDAGGDGGNDGNEQGSGDNTGEETQSGTNVLQSISINELDAKRQFNIGESFSSEGLTVTALITNLGGTGGSQNPDVTDKAVINSSAFDSSKPGTYPIYISYTFGGITLYASYNVTVVSAIEGTIAGLEVSFSGERQYSLVAANSETVPAIDLSKLTVTQVVGEDANNTTETALTRSQYELSYSVDGGEAVAVPESQTTIPVTQKGVYSVYASATYTSGGESFEMNGFVAVYAVDPVVSLVYNNDGTKEFDYNTDATIGSDWTYTLTYNSGATETLEYEDVTLEGISSVNEGQNTATATYTEEQLGYSSENQDAVMASYTQTAEVVYTIKENPNTGSVVEDEKFIAWKDSTHVAGDKITAGDAIVDSQALTVASDVDIAYAYGYGSGDGVFSTKADAAGAKSPTIDGEQINGAYKTTVDTAAGAISGNYVFTAKGDMTLTVYVVFTNNSFNSDRPATITYTVSGSTAQTKDGSGRNNMVEITVELKAGQTLTINATNNHASNGGRFYFCGYNVVAAEVSAPAVDPELFVAWKDSEHTAGQEVTAGDAIVDSQALTITSDVDIAYAYGYGSGEGVFSTKDDAAGAKSPTIDGEQINGAYKTTEDTAAGAISGNYVFTAKGDMTLTVYVVFTNNSFNSDRPATITYTVSGSTAQTKDGSGRNNMVEITVELKAGQTLTINATNNHASNGGRFYFCGYEVA